jgi:hypothetical protein
MGLGVEKRMVLLSGWIEDRARANGVAEPAVRAEWSSTGRRWWVYLESNGTREDIASHGQIMTAMRSLWDATQKRWPKAVTVPL